MEWRKNRFLLDHCNNSRGAERKQQKPLQSTHIHTTHAEDRQKLTAAAAAAAVVRVDRLIGKTLRRCRFHLAEYFGNRCCIFHWCNHTLFPLEFLFGRKAFDGARRICGNRSVHFVRARFATAFTIDEKCIVILRHCARTGWPDQHTKHGKGVVCRPTD